MTPPTWRTLPDADKDEIFLYLAWRDEQLDALRATLVEKKKLDGVAAVLLYIEGL